MTSEFHDLSFPEIFQYFVELESFYEMAGHSPNITGVYIPSS